MYTIFINNCIYEYRNVLFFLSIFVHFVCCKLYDRKAQDDAADNRANNIPATAIYKNIVLVILLSLHLSIASPEIFDIITVIMNIIICIFAIFLPIINKNISKNDYVVIQSIFCVLGCYTMLVPQGQLEIFPSQNWEQIRIMLHMQAYGFLMSYYLILSSVFIIKSLIKPKKHTRLVVSEVTSKIIIIISEILNYIIIVHDEYNSKIITIYCFIAEAVVIPVMISLLQQKTHK